MMTLEGYNFSENLYKGTRTEVYRGTRISDLQPVIIKVLRNPHPNFNQLVQFRNQYVITRNIEHRAIVRPLALERYGNGYALVMPDDGAIALSDYWPRSDRSLTEFIAIAMELADALHYLTQERIVHKDIKPANILIHPETGKVKLIDFSISSLLPKEEQQLINPNVLEGTLAYISPEQTGRMNRGIDYRTDFYSLGVTFYELLTGFLPFSSRDPMELVHCHMAQTVQFPAKGQVNEVVQAIVLKLMAKNAENRYQSALGLQHDLRICLQQLEGTGKITRFKIGQQDRCDRFIIPEKLYGRKAEVQTLLAAFDRVSAGATEMMLVAGFSGIGKTAVVNEVHKPIVRQRGYFIKGKFDQFNRNIPFRAFVQAFRALMGQLLGESDASLQEWKAKILEAVGENGQVLIDVIPELERIIGSQPPVPELSGNAAQNRFNLLFQKLLAVFTTQEHPLTLFLDDLQWADSASLNLMKVLMADSQTGYLLLLGAYRDNEVFPAHPLMLSLAELEKQKITISTITLAQLSVSNINQLVAEALSCVVELATPLTDLVYQKTRGNPFFTTQFLKGLHQDGLIAFDRNLGYWECDLVKVRDAALTDDVVEFMAGRLHKLPIATQKVLKLAACIGNQFDLETLAIICETPSEEVAADMWSALREGLILPQSEAYKFFQGWEKDEGQAEGITVGYRFLHDRVQQAGYSLIPEDRKQQTHLTIGRLLFGHTSEENLEDKIFDVVNHLNMGVDLITTDEEKKQLCELNLQAGRKAKNATAYEAAIEYLLLGIELLTENSWECDYELTLGLYESATESAYLNGDFEKMEQLAEVGLNNARALLDSLKFYEVKIQAFEARTRFQEALDTAAFVLEKLGIRQFPKEPDFSDIELWLKEVKVNLGDRHPMTLAELNLMSDPNMLAAMRLLFYVTPTAYKYKPALMVLIGFTKVNLSLRYGNSPMSTYGYSIQGLVLCDTFGEIEQGYQFGQLALQLDRQSNAIAYGRAFFVAHGMIKHYKEHLRNTLNSLKESYAISIEIGDLEYVGYSLAFYSLYSYLCGKELSALARELSENSNALGRINRTTPQNWIDIYRQIVENLLGGSQNPCAIVGEAYDEEKMLPLCKQANDLTTQSYFYVPRAFLCYLFQDWDGALESLENAERCLGGAAATPLVNIFYFYQSLVMLAEFASQPENECQERLEKIATNQKILKNAASHAPTNYLHKWHLVEAENYRVLGDKTEAMEQYDRAIAGAKANEYIQEEALANELAAKFYLDWRKEKIAATYMQEAYYCYARWGAKAKTDQLETQYRQLLTPILQQTQAPLKIGQTLSTTQSRGTATEKSSVLDLASAIKAGQAISEEISLDALLCKLMHILVENAGADMGSLILNHSGTLVLCAQWVNGKTHLANTPIDDADRLPLSIINTVKRSQKTLLINDISQDTSFAGDPYLIEQQPLCLFCTPILHQGQLRGILYLENHLTAGAFTSDRIEVLNLLTAQAAISIENAQLYNTLEQKVKERTAELSVALEDLKAAQKQLVESEKMAALGGLVAGVAHEINTPIGTSITVASTLADETQSFLNAVKLGQLKRSVLNNYLDLADESTQLMLSNLNRAGELIGSFKQIATDQSNLEQRRFHLKQYLCEVAGSLAPQLKQTPHTLTVAGDSDITIESYPGALAQIMTNLVTNSLSHGYPSGEVGQLRWEIYLDGDKVKVEYSDDGCGISRENLGKIFDPFFTTARNQGGTGLGLHIVYNLVTQKLLGTLVVSSEVGAGTRFVMTLPKSVN